MGELNAKKRLTTKSIFIAVVILLATAGIFFGVFKNKITEHNNPKTTSNKKAPGAGPSVVEKTVETPTKTALASSDYVTYQNLQRTLALQYLYNSDTTNAERIMNDIFKNVPSVKIASSSYLTMIRIQEAKQDKDQQKHYLQLAIDKLNAEGNPTQAANEQKVLDGLQ